jgi:hypothetical protein
MFGPGEYDTRHRASDPRAPAYTLGGRGRSWINPNDNPSGAAYLPNYAFQHPTAPKVAIHQLHTTPESDTTPGPGSYNIPDDFGQPRTTVHPIVPPLKPFATPGAVRYDSPRPGIAIAIGHQFPTNQFPPARHQASFYNVPRFGEKTAMKTMHAPVHEPATFQTPGPGTYEERNSWMDGKGIRMGDRSGTQLRTTWLPESSTPGPGRYRPQPDKTERAAPSWSFRDGLGTSWTYKPQNPSPDTYNAKKATHAPRWTLRPTYPIPEPDRPTADAGYYLLPPQRPTGILIRNRETLELIPE